MGAQKDSEEDVYSEDDEFVNNSEVNTEEQKQPKGAKGSAAPRISVDDEDDDYEFWGVYPVLKINEWLKLEKKVLNFP